MASWYRRLRRVMRHKAAGIATVFVLMLMAMGFGMRIAGKTVTLLVVHDDTEAQQLEKVIEQVFRQRADETGETPGILAWDPEGLLGPPGSAWAFQNGDKTFYVPPGGDWQVPLKGKRVFPAWERW